MDARRAAADRLMALADPMLAGGEAREGTMMGHPAGEPSAPVGGRFREWVAVPRDDPDPWSRLLREAREFVALG